MARILFAIGPDRDPGLDHGVRWLVGRHDTEFVMLLLWKSVGESKLESRSEMTGFRRCPAAVPNPCTSQKQLGMNYVTTVWRGCNGLEPSVITRGIELQVTSSLSCLNLNKSPVPGYWQPNNPNRCWIQAFSSHYISYSRIRDSRSKHPRSMSDHDTAISNFCELTGASADQVRDNLPISPAGSDLYLTPGRNDS